MLTFAASESPGRLAGKAPNCDPTRPRVLRFALAFKGLEIFRIQHDILTERKFERPPRNCCLDAQSCALHLPISTPFCQPRQHHGHRVGVLHCRSITGNYLNTLTILDVKIRSRRKVAAVGAHKMSKGHLSLLGLYTCPLFSWRETCGKIRPLVREMALRFRNGYRYA